MTLETWGKWAVLAAAAEEVLGGADLSDGEIFRLQKLAHELGAAKGITAATALLAAALELAVSEIAEHGSSLDLSLRALDLWEG